MTTLIHQPVDIKSVLTEELLRKFDTPGPRYTSYPTADRFAEKFGPADAVRVLQARGRVAPDAPLSLYVHIPFCESLCYYCGCNKIVTKHHERAADSSTRSWPNWPWSAARSDRGVRCRNCTSAAARRPSCPTPNSAV